MGTSRTSVKLGLRLAFFVFAFPLFALSGWHGDWYGGVGGGMIGVFSGLVFSGQGNGRWLGVFSPPADDRRGAGADADYNLPE